ncbi:hypothetical protein BCU70_13650 [Vibrio sp. 10N.286.49.C2]|nr:hypothetical protein BCU70_13650 [Vibrio sp. 10N.286.49.C2]PMH83784.1 hypothetical protein BCU58_13425 [Vibrio sp. 10N.286.48.B7]
MFTLFFLLFYALPLAAADVDVLFPEKQVNSMIDLAFETKSVRYTSFATQFNFCQQKPTHPDCTDSYENKQRKYKSAKANHDVLKQVYHRHMTSLLMPEVAYPELVSSLQLLAYLEAGPDADILFDDTLNAVNEWLVMHDFPKTDDVYFLHSLMIEAEAMHQNLRDEEA